jgi:hypothetical protein
MPDLRSLTHEIADEFETAQKDRIDSDKRKGYMSFLMSFSHQLDLKNSTETPRQNRPRLQSDENICLTLSQVEFI